MPYCNDQIDHFNSKKSPVDSREIIYSVSIMNVDPSLMMAGNTDIAAYHRITSPCIVSPLHIQLNSTSITFN
ncbi:hypothetical protein HZ326_10795 [Fusarium oxysporum f. sp. albedinis]|nr:hypothetical protein HZ326_10795 [Fusarium oxysporum f. sp. albedinis]